MANDFSLRVGEFGRYPPPSVYQLCVPVRDQKERLLLMAPRKHNCNNKN